MPAAKQQPLAAVIKATARSCRSRHSQFPSNGKSPDAVPGAVDIAIVSPNVSSCSPRKFTTQLVAGEKSLLAGLVSPGIPASLPLRGEKPSLRAKRSNPFFLYAARWIASLRSQ
jgi:hypothetical protein